MTAKHRQKTMQLESELQDLEPSQTQLAQGFGNMMEHGLGSRVLREFPMV